jgi:hypothetical protein
MLPPIILAYKLYSSVVLTCFLLSDLHTNCTILWSFCAPSYQTCIQIIQFCGPYMLPPTCIQIAQLCGSFVLPLIRLAYKLYSSVDLTCSLLSDLHIKCTTLWFVHAPSHLIGCETLLGRIVPIAVVVVRTVAIFVGLLFHYRC